MLSARLGPSHNHLFYVGELYGFQSKIDKKSDNRGSRRGMEGAEGR